MSATSDKIVNNFHDDDTTFSQNVASDGMYEFLSKYFKDFNPIG